MNETNNAKKVSVVVPCYNVSRTLDRCMENLVKQSIGIGHMEIILVDDASTDNSYTKMCAWEMKYPDSIIVIQCAENGGPGEARNIGIQYASGKYIGFVDDDDSFHEQMFEILYNCASKHSCEVAVCNSMRQVGKYQKLENDVNDSQNDTIIQITNDKERLSLLDRDINDAVWNKLYLREFIIAHKIQFPPHIYYEDIFFSHLVKMYSVRLYITPRILYCHILSDASISLALDVRKPFQYIQVHMMLIEEIKRRKLYAPFSVYYEKLMVIAYVGAIDNYKTNADTIDLKILQKIKNILWSLLPNLDQLNIVDYFPSSQNSQQIQEICKDLIKKE